MKKNNGITLVALVITILVLLILVGISISLVIGNNGIVEKAQESKSTYYNAEEEEKIRLAVASSKINSMDFEGLNQEALQSELNNLFGSNYTLESNNDNSFFVNFQNPDRKYYIGENDEVIGSRNMIGISNADELKEFRDNVNSGDSYSGKYVFLRNNITLSSSETWEPIGKNVDTEDPYSDANYRFRGIFDGCNYEINGISISTSHKIQGLFGLIDGGKVMNLGIGTSNSISGGNATAGISALGINGTVISNCCNKANITSNNGEGAAGVIWFLKNGKTINCYNTGNISGGKSTGGIIGRTTTISMKDCYNTGSVSTTTHASSTGANMGGLIGYALGGENISNCYNTGTVSGTMRVGGICGSAWNYKIDQCYNKGNISGTNGYVGGISGFCSVSNNLKCEILNCYNIGTISGGQRVGGIVGHNENTSVKNSYSVGTITASGSNFGGIYGLDNYNQGTFTNVYYLQNSVNGNDSGATLTDCARTSAVLKNAETLSLLGDKFAQDTGSINSGYPILAWQN